MIELVTVTVPALEASERMPYEPLALIEQLVTVRARPAAVGANWMP